MAPELPQEQQQPTRRFALGKFVKNAAPSEDVVAQILEKRVEGKMPEMRGTGNGNGAPQTAQLEQIADGIGQLFDLMMAVHDQDKTTNKAFDALYSELGSYKNDFFYERLKPFARSLLFLMDSIQSYSEEVEAHEKEGKMLHPTSVKAHVDHIAEELRDALQLVEMAPIEEEGDEFNPRQQRAVEVISVESAQDGKVMKVVRPGYTMGGTMLRPADVVVGKKG